VLAASERSFSFYFHSTWRKSSTEKETWPDKCQIFCGRGRISRQLSMSLMLILNFAKSSKIIFPSSSSPSFE